MPSDFTRRSLLWSLAAGMLAVIVGVTVHWSSAPESIGLQIPVVCAAFFDSALAASLFFVSLRRGLGTTVTFWVVFVSGTAAIWVRQFVSPDANPAMIRPTTSDQVFLVGLAGLLGVFALRNSQSRASFVCPAVGLLELGGGALWTALFATAGRVALTTTAMLCPALQAPQLERVLDYTAPAEFQELTNPFQSPGWQAIVDSLGERPNDAIQVIRAAVVNRTEGQARRLAVRLPAVIRTDTDRAEANELTSRLQAAGASASVVSASARFARIVADDAPTPLGRPSQLADAEALRTGHDRIAELRARLSHGEADDELAHRAWQAYIALEGQALFQWNCRPCHGTKGTGDGPLSAAFTVAPANLREPGRLESLSLGDLVWRIEEGGIALPAENAPWASAMPAWKHDFDRETVWKIVIGLFETAGLSPERARRTPTPRGFTLPARRREPVHRANTPRHDWGDWPVVDRPAASQMVSAGFVEQGRSLYVAHCSACHGISGEGNGPVANTLWPRPRDFSSSKVAGGTSQPKFKFRSTRTGWLPTDDDLFRTISRGLVGTAMEGWADALTPIERWQLVAYLKTFSRAWRDPEADNPAQSARVAEETAFRGASPVTDFTVLSPPAATREQIFLGEQMFYWAQCWQCHGIGLRGDGPGFGNHFDVWGFRAWPQNLRGPGRFKAGSSTREIFRTFSTGIDGSVMPSFQDTLVSAEGLVAPLIEPNAPASRRERSRALAHELLGADAAGVLRDIDGQDAEASSRAVDRLRAVAHAADESRRWALAAFVASQVQTRHLSRRVAPAALFLDRLPIDPTDPRWDDQPATTVPLTGQLHVAPRWQTPSVDQVEVKVVRTNDSIAVWLRWDDRQANVARRDLPYVEPDDDGGLAGKSYAYPAISRNSPVSFSFVDQLELQWPQTRGSATPPHFLFGSRHEPVVLWRWSADRQQLTRRVVRRSMPSALGDSTVDREEWAVPTENDSVTAVVTWASAGERLQPAPEVATSATIRSRARWWDGRWTLVLVRPLSVSGRDDVDLRPASGASPVFSVPDLIPVAIHAWDGAAGETDNRMCVSSWFYIALSERSASRALMGFAAGFVITFASLAALTQVLRRKRT